MKLPRLTYANVVATLALFLALGMGTAWAATQLTKNSVKARHIAGKQVKPRHLANNAVVTGSIRNGAVTEAKLAGSLTSSMADGSSRGRIVLNANPANVTVSSTNWPTPANGQVSVTWTQPPNTIDVIAGRARVVHTSGCVAANGQNGIEIKAIHAEDNNRVISADAATGGFHGNGSVNDDGAKEGLLLASPYSGAGPQRTDYIRLPFELMDYFTGGSSATRTIRLMLRKRGCGGNGASIGASNPQLTNIRIYVTRYK